MKKVMLFITSMLFAVSVNAASINMVNDVLDSAVLVGIVPNDASTVVGSYSNTDGGAYRIGNAVTSDVATAAKVTWTFNDPADFVSAAISFGESFEAAGWVGNVITGSYSFIAQLAAGVTQFFDIEGVSTAGKAMGVQLSVSAVPVPAALFLFAPALLGFLGLRRKATLAA